MQRGGGTDASVEAAFTRLSAQLKNRQFKKALKSIEEILKANPNDLDALKCKAISLIESSKFADALELLDSSQLSSQYAFERAYCLYRAGKFSEALAACQQVSEDRTVPKLHLQAQLHYRLGQMSEAIQLYKQLLQQHKVHSLELSTNVVAAHVAAGRSGDVAEIMAVMRIGPHEGFEVAFNLGCAQLACNDFEAAHDQLLHAQRLGQEALLDEDLEGDALDEELAPVALQLALAASKLGRRSEASAAYQSLSRLKLDEESNAILQSNTLAESLLSSPESASKKTLSDAIRKVDSLIQNASGLQLVQPLNVRLAEGQQQALLVNYALLLLLAGRTSACETVSSALAQRWPQAQSVALLQAAQAAQAGRPAEADSALARALQAAASSDQQPWPQLMQAQLAAARGDAEQASASAARALSGEASRPAAVATLASLAEAAGDVDGALDTVRAALQTQGIVPGTGKARIAPGQEHGAHWLLQRMAGLQLQAGDVSGALATFVQLKAAGGGAGAGALRVLGQLAKAAVSGDARNLKGIDGLEAQLPPVQALPEDDIDRMEASVPGAGTMRRKRGKEVKERKDDAPRKRHKKKPRLPRGFEPANPGPPPDPERWLPKWQRSDFKRRRGQRRREKDAVKGSQGAGKVDESLDRTKMDIDPEEGTSASAVKPPAGSRKKKGGRR